MRRLTYASTCKKPTKVISYQPESLQLNCKASLSDRDHYSTEGRNFGMELDNFTSFFIAF